MDGTMVDRIAKRIAGRLPRRAAVEALAGTTLATVALWLGVGQRGATAACRKRLQTCKGKANKKCCNKSGLIRCQQPTKQACVNAHGTRRRCCGLDGASCDPTLGDCDCCGVAVCISFPDGPRCEETPK